MTPPAVRWTELARAAQGVSVNADMRRRTSHIQLDWYFMPQSTCLFLPLGPTSIQLRGTK
jgi:hypothetical protein